MPCYRSCSCTWCGSPQAIPTFSSKLLIRTRLWIVLGGMSDGIRRISVATVTSFIARGLSTTQYFCYPALASSGVVLILPGYAIRECSVLSLEMLRSYCGYIVCGSLELASKNIVTGSVRMVYAIIYSLFLVSSNPEKKNSDNSL